MQTKLDLKEEVLEELAFDPRVDADDIAVTAADGVITLRGTIPNPTQRWHAIEAVKRVRGVRGIADELIVELPATHRRTDTDIALAIEQRFASSTMIPATVKFIVKDGHVALSGEVPWYYQMEEAESQARSVIGVKDTTNLMTVVSKASLSADEIKRRIRSELARMADIDADNINVGVADGLVTLTGSVRTSLERDKAMQAAWSLPGVQRVDNHVVVNPSPSVVRP
jgi:osmotically-inducible protein OsmY